MTIKNKYLLFIFCIALYTNGYAQGFKAKAIIEPVPATGFYKLPLTPDVTSLAKTDLSDVRITTDSNSFVPYINQKEIAQISTAVYTKLPMLNNSTAGRYTNVVIENTIPGGITGLSLMISNTAVERYTTLSGSDDKNSWYIIADSIRFQRANTNSEGKYIQTIFFPLSKYKYLKLKINNSTSDPLRIISAGIYKDRDTTEKSYTNNPTPSFIQKDSNNHISYITIKNATSYITDRITMEIKGPKFYNRSATTFIMHDDKDSADIRYPISNFTITSDNHCSFYVNNQKAYAIVIEINNGDNPPLKVTGISTSQETQYLVAWMEQGKAYNLLVGNITAPAPQYDLSHFKNNIPSTVPQLSYGPLMALPVISAPVLKSASNYWLWPTIILAVVTLSLLTFRLMKDVNVSEKK